MSNLIIKNSEINGKGIFANKDFKKGEIILEWDTTHELKEEEVKELSDNEKKYVSYENGKYILMQEPEKYMNHSCDSNTYAKEFQDIAKKDIKKGEEITTTYPEEEIPDNQMKCNCKSKNCRGIIN
jgi:SET domain-containing protein